MELPQAIIDPLYQYGILGVLFAYVIYSDYTSRKERTKAEIARTNKDNKREEDCTKRIRELEERNLKFMQHVASKTNSVLTDLTRELRRHGFRVNVPAPPENDHEDTTRIIHRNIKDI